MYVEQTCRATGLLQLDLLTMMLMVFLELENRAQDKLNCEVQQELRAVLRRV